MSHVVFGKHFPGENMCETERSRDATASFIVAKVLGEVFGLLHAIGVKGHSSMQN
jgi:hypothetical protein